MKNAGKYCLLTGIILPLTLLLWPFAQWGGAASLLLRLIPSACAQLLFCRWKGWGLLPLLLTLALALWGTWLYVTSPHWSNATLWSLLADYGSPAVACIFVLIIRQGKRT